MPNINEFINKKNAEVLHAPELERVDGIKPCSKCESNAEYAMWDPRDMILSWKCSDGHDNQFKVN
jgi:hypothetical protein